MQEVSSIFYQILVNLLFRVFSRDLFNSIWTRCLRISGQTVLLGYFVNQIYQTIFVCFEFKVCEMLRNSLIALKSFQFEKEKKSAKSLSSFLDCNEITVIGKSCILCKVSLVWCKGLSLSSSI